MDRSPRKTQESAKREQAAFKGDAGSILLRLDKGIDYVEKVFHIDDWVLRAAYTCARQNNCPTASCSGKAQGRVFAAINAHKGLCCYGLDQGTRSNITILQQFSRCYIY